ncbi:hypothetical protein HanXRQr2_Chr02g0061921 [Helianthus annuus]|uniref:Uncharacterized protein n=1 Tax=Helianthus annuus TaxID=4232 RepID=A0A9K3JNJ3_HELAN|nr:hypothetical protein HanXRQr2_Chr02g0061921 [Helianthus annuus]KAJ0951512.1 hypothetical protein HanPSC8_Chr02g0060941 [Helianthus annuus]
MMSASETCFSTSVLKNRFLPLHDLTTSSSPGSYIGSWSLFQAAIRETEISTTATSMSGHLWAITAIVGPPT